MIRPNEFIDGVVLQRSVSHKYGQVQNPLRLSFFFISFLIQLLMGFKARSSDVKLLKHPKYDIFKKYNLRNEPQCSKTTSFGKESISLWAFWFRWCFDIIMSFRRLFSSKCFRKLNVKCHGSSVKSLVINKTIVTRYD